MTEPGQFKKIPEMTTLNKILGLCLFCLLAWVLYDIGSRKHLMNTHISEKALLEKQMSQSLLLEKFYLTLEQKDTTLGHDLAFLGQAVSEGNPDLSDQDRFLLLAEHNRMHLDWVDTVWEDGSDTSQRLLAVSLNGDFQGLRGMLLDILALPYLSHIPLIQVISENGELDIMLNVTLFNPKEEKNGEVAP